MSREEIGQYGQAHDPYAATFGNHRIPIEKNYAGQMSPTPAAQSPLTNVINDLRRKVSALESLTEAMEGKLAPILVSIPESPMKEAGGITGAQSAIVMELSELEYRLGMLCRRIDTLITRVQA